MTDPETTGGLAMGAAFLTGLLGTGHCLGMCGSLVCAFFAHRPTPGVAAPLAYHAARIAVYGLLGLAAAAFGTVLTSTGRFGLAQGVLQIVAGVLVVALGVELSGVLRWQLPAALSPVRWLNAPLGAARRRGPIAGAAMGGVVNGLMPCSMTMAMAVQASTAPSVPEGVLLMLAFGAGTLPALLSAAWLFGRIGLRARLWLVRVTALLIIALGATTLWQGVQYTRVMYRLVG